MNVLRLLVRRWNRHRPWWWLLVARKTGWATWGWEVAPHNEVRLPAVVGLEVLVRGRGHRIVAEEGVTLQNVVLDIRGEGHRVTLGRGSFLRDVYVRIRGRNNLLTLGPGVRFSQGGEIWLEDEGSRIQIDADTTIVQAHLSALEGTTLHLRDSCLLAYDVEIRTGDSHSIVDAATGARLNPSADVVVGPRVWVGARAMILKGARIPPDSVVAAGAVVTKAFDEPGIVLAGHPARVLRRGIRWLPERIPVPEG